MIEDESRSWNDLSQKVLRLVKTDRVRFMKLLTAARKRALETLLINDTEKALIRVAAYFESGGWKFYPAKEQWSLVCEAMDPDPRSAKDLLRERLDAYRARSRE